MNKRLLLIVLIISVQLLSCKKFLDKKSDTSLVVPETIEDMQALLDDIDIMNNLQTPSYGEASANDYYVSESNYDRFGRNVKDAYMWRNFDYKYPNDWADGYNPVFNANLCLEAIEKVSITDQNKAAWENVKGSALFFRAYYYLHLAWTFAKVYDESTAASDLGIVLRTGTNFNIRSQRATVKETYDSIISDATRAIEYLGEQPLNVYRPSKAAAYGLLARIYLSMRKYEEALENSDLSLQLKETLMDFNGDPDINSLTGNVTFKSFPFNKEVLFFTSMTQNYTSRHPLYGRIDTLLYASYATDDLRRKAYFRSQTGQRFKGSYVGDQNNLFTGIATDEMLITRAECYARNGMTTEAMTDLNTLLKKRWSNLVPYPEITAIDAAEALDKILVERRKELLMRGLRWMDIKRLNKEGKNIVPVRIMKGETVNLPVNDNRYALPLPKDIIDQTGMQQN